MGLLVCLLREHPLRKCAKEKEVEPVSYLKPISTFKEHPFCYVLFDQRGHIAKLESKEGDCLNGIERVYA